MNKNKDFELWIHSPWRIELSPCTRLYADVEGRWADEASTLFQAYGQVRFGVDVTKWLEIAPGYRQFFFLLPADRKWETIYFPLADALLKFDIYCDVSEAKGMTNAAHLSGQQHPLNTHIIYNKDEKKDRTAYTGRVQFGDGSVNSFYSLPQCGFSVIGASRKANGNYLTHNYELISDHVCVLASIKAYNSTGGEVVGICRFYL